MAGALLDLFEFFERFSIQRCQGPQDLKTGDVVACFDNITKKCLSVGTVKHVGRTELPEGHSDGEFGEVFVLSFDKGRSKKGQPFNKQDGWWLYAEIAVLPRQGENFSPNSIVKNVMFVGHKATTRQEQARYNWSIEVQPLEVQDVTQDPDTDQELDHIAMQELEKKKKNRKRKRPATKKKRKQTKKGSDKSPAKPAASASKTLRRSPRKTGFYCFFYIFVDHIMYRSSMHKPKNMNQMKCGLKPLQQSRIPLPPGGERTCKQTGVL